MTNQKRFLPLSGFWLALLVAVLTGGAVVADYVTGTDFDYLIFYLIPLLMVAWRWGGWRGYAFIVVGLLGHAVADRLSSPTYMFPAFFYWNLAEDSIILSLLVFFLTRLKHTLLQLQEALRLKTEFLNIAAHDLKNPLSGVLGFSDLLAHPDAARKPAEVTELATLINNSAHRMLYLIRNLLDISKYENGQIHLNPAGLDLAVITTRLLAQNEPRASQKQLTLCNELKDATAVWADQSLTEQIMDNLLSNAIKFSPPGKSIFIRSESAGKQVLWKVQDQGPGLSRDDQAKLFQKFTRLSAKPTGGENSTGLGLSIVKLLVEAMHGRVWCESELGQGATFIIALPQTNPAGNRR
jgi:signal transduction histidine kinase